MSPHRNPRSGTGPRPWRARVTASTGWPRFSYHTPGASTPAANIYESWLRSTNSPKQSDPATALASSTRPPIEQPNSAHSIWRCLIRRSGGMRDAADLSRLREDQNGLPSGFKSHTPAVRSGRDSDRWCQPPRISATSSSLPIGTTSNVRTSVQSCIHLPIATGLSDSHRT
jgi:hypothetical protein